MTDTIKRAESALATNLRQLLETGITPAQRTQIATHERMHLLYANLRGRMHPEVYKKSLEEIEKFEKGEA